MAVDNRRHDAVDRDGESVVHLAMAMSTKDLHEQLKIGCPPLCSVASTAVLAKTFFSDST